MTTLRLLLAMASLTGMAEVATAQPQTWYTMDVRGFPKTIAKGTNVLVIEKAYVRNNGENGVRGDGAIGLHLYYKENEEWKRDKLMQLFGPRFTGLEDDGTKKWEWSDWEGVRYTGFGLLQWSTKWEDGWSIRIKLEEGDHGLGKQDIVFDETISVAELKTGKTVEVNGKVAGHDATLWLRTYPVWPPPTAHGSHVGAPKKGPMAGGNGGLYFKDLGPGTAVDRVMVGLKVRCGERVDAVQPIFRAVTADGKLGKLVNGDSHGWDGGTANVISREGYVVTGLKVRTGSRVDKIQLIVRKWLGNGSLGSEEVIGNCGGGGGEGRYLRAAAGEVVVGIHGRSGKEIDAIGLFTSILQ